MSVPHPFETLLPQQAPGLRHRALKLTGQVHRAEDLVQTTLLRAWASRDSFLPDSNLRAWLFTILRNAFFSDLRKYRLEVEDIDGRQAERLFEAPRQIDMLALNEVLAALASLPAAQRNPLVMMGIYGLSQSEVALACGCTIGTVKSRVSRGRASLQRFGAQM